MDPPGDAQASEEPSASGMSPSLNRSASKLSARSKSRVTFDSSIPEYASDNSTDNDDFGEEVGERDLLNSCGLAVTTRRSIRSHASLETCLLTAGIQVEDNVGSGTGVFLPHSPFSRGLTGSSSQKSEGTVQSKSSVSSNFSDWLSEASTSSVGAAWDKDLLRRFFTDGRGSVRMKPTHLALDSIVRHVINVELSSQDVGGREVSSGSLSRSSLLSAVSAFVEAASTSCLYTWRRTLRRGVHRVVSCWLFQNFFLVLTFYALFGPDLAKYAGSVETDEIFLYINTSVFAAFILEFLLLTVGRSWYLLSMVALLDAVSVLSMVGDTWLILVLSRWFLANENSMFQEEEAQLSRLARSSRVTRLVRLTKIARAGRLLPRLLQLIKRRQSPLARKVLLKKVWRVFLFLDSDGDGFVSMLDLKVFYFNVLQECEHMLYTRRQNLLRWDIGVFDSAEAALLKEDSSGRLLFDDFCRIFLSTRGGKEVLRFFTEDIEQASTVSALTNKLSERVALKTCLLVLLLVVAMSLCEIDTQDNSPEQGLAQLDRMARTEHSGNSTNSTYLCSQIAVYRLRHEVLFLFLDGRTHFDSGRCSAAGVPSADLDPFARAEALLAQMGLRASELLQACVPAALGCSAGSSASMVLLDQRAQATEDSLFALLTMLTIVALLILFVLVLKVKIQKFTGMLVTPLRSLADDMVAMSSLEILTMSKDDLVAPFPEPKSEIRELRLLEDALKSMRTNIRSWAMYVPPCVVQRLFSKGIEATIGVARCNVSILFCDIDGFEDACADLSPKDVLHLLSEVLGKIADVIEERHGTLLEFIGDEVLAVFNTPQFVKHHAYAAVASALEIHRAVDGLPKMVLDAGREISVRCRIGVNSASIFAGNIGSDKRMKYGMLGDGVNLAARLKTLNSLYRTRTLVSAAVIEDRACSKMFVHRPVDVVAVKGKKQPTVVFEVVGATNSSGDLLRKAAAKHIQGFALYRERQFTEAAKRFAHAGALFAAGGLAERVAPAMRRRCNALIEKPPADDWDGVERLTRKSWEEATDDAPEAVPDSSLGSIGTSRQDHNLVVLDVLDSMEPLEPLPRGRHPIYLNRKIVKL